MVRATAGPIAHDGVSSTAHIFAVAVALVPADSTEDVLEVILFLFAFGAPALGVVQSLAVCRDREFRSGSLSGCLLAVACHSQLFHLSCNLHLPPHNTETGVGEDAVRKAFLSLSFPSLQVRS